MKGYSHALVSGALFVSVFLSLKLGLLTRFTTYTPPWTGITLLLPLLLGSIFPDVDHENSHITHWIRIIIPTIIFIIAVIITHDGMKSAIVGGIAGAMTWLIAEIAHHRGFIHSYTCISLITLAGIIILPQLTWLVFIPFAGGYVLHLFEDGEFCKIW